MGQFTPLLAEIADSEASLDDIRRDSEHIDFYFPGKLGSELETVLRYPCTGDCVSAPIPPPDLTAAAISQLRGFLNSLPFSGVQGDESAGMPVAFDFPAEVSTQNRTILENLVRMFQVSIAQSDTWVAQESNGNGSFEAAYRRSGRCR